MQVWAVVSQKGGSGKTTLAIHMAIAAMQDGKSVLVIDLDPQRSAEKWAEIRGQDDLAIVAGEAPRLNDMLEAAKKAGADLAIIDTAPRMERTAVAVAKEADLVLIPMRPTVLDIPATQDTLELDGQVNGLKDRARIIINSVTARSNEGEEAVPIFAEKGIAVCPQFLGERIEYRRALTEGKGVTEFSPKSKAAAEMTAVYRWICKQASALGEHGRRIA
jgi:chromosome partitioning protein